jgi:hypothetical protein
MTLLYGFHALREYEPVPREGSTRWFTCRYCGTTFYGGLRAVQPVREEAAAAVAHERECYGSRFPRRIPPQLNDPPWLFIAPGVP